MELNLALKALDSLAQRARLDIFRLLVQRAPVGVPAGEIAAKVGIPAATLSFHLNHLSNAGLIESHRQGRSIIYSIRVETIRELMAFLTHDCCNGRPELCGYGVNESLCCETGPTPNCSTRTVG